MHRKIIFEQHIYLQNFELVIIIFYVMAVIYSHMWVVIIGSGSYPVNIA